MTTNPPAVVPAAAPRRRSDPTPARRAVAAELQHAMHGPARTQGLSPRRLAELTGLTLFTVRGVLSNMRDVGQAINVGTRHAPRYRAPLPEDREGTVGVSREPPSGTYNAVELRPFDGRPGAMDAFLLPSLVNGVQVPARRPTAQLVGALTDRSDNARG